MSLLSCRHALAALLLSGCTTFSDTDVGGESGAGGSLAGASGQAGGGAGQGGQGGASAGGAGQGGLAGQGGAGTTGGAGEAGMSGSSGQSGAAGAGGQGPGGAAGQAGAAAVCGDGKREGSEACDGADLAGKSCQTEVGPSSTGSLACKADCSLDQSGCAAPSTCGNGVIDNGEECDGQVFGTATCTSVVKEPAQGALTCSPQCTIDTASCRWCGDGQADTGDGEECDDGNADDADGCTSACKTPTCGDGIVQSGEECDPKLTPSACTPACTKKCDGVPGGFQAGSTCYVILSGDVAWAQAQAKCQALSSGQYRLASLETKAEIDQLGFQLINPLLNAWLGGHRVDGKLTWLTGAPVSFEANKAPWDTDEPSPDGDCIFVKGNAVKAALRTDKCDETYDTLCEW